MKKNNSKIKSISKELEPLAVKAKEIAKKYPNTPEGLRAGADEFVIGKIEGQMKVNPTLYKVAQKSRNVEEFINKISKGKPKTVDTDVLKNYYNMARMTKSQLINFYNQATKGQRINNNNLHIEKENRKFKSFDELELYLEKKSFLSLLHRILEIIKEKPNPIETIEEAKEKLLYWWNKITLKEKRLELSIAELKYLIVWHFKKDVVEAEEKKKEDKILNPVTEEEILEVKEWLDDVRKKHNIKGVIPKKIVLEELKLEKK